MKKIRKITGIVLILVPLVSRAEVKEIPFTLDDRDRIIRTEQKVEALEAMINNKVDGLHTEMNARFEAVDHQFDVLFSFLWAIIGIFTAMIMSVFGFAFWDRKLSL